MKAKVTPGFDGRPPIHGADAYDSDRPAGPKRKRYVHPLDHMLSMGFISHEQWLAGVRFRSDWELAHCAGELVVNWDRLINAVTETDRRRSKGTQVMKPAKQPFSYNEIQPRIVDTKASLERLARRMSHTGFALLVFVCGKGLGIGEIAKEWKDDRKYLGRRFREALDEAAQFYGEEIDARERA